MDTRERLENPTETFLAALEGWQAGIWTALPGIVQTFDQATGTATVQPAIQARVRDAGPARFNIAGDASAVESAAPRTRLGTDGARKKLLPDSFLALYSAPPPAGLQPGAGETGPPLLPLNPPGAGTEPAVVTAQ